MTVSPGRTTSRRSREPVNATRQFAVTIQFLTSPFWISISPKMLHKIITPSLAIPLTLVAAISFASCSRGGPNSSTSSTSPDAQSSPASTPKTGFEADLEYVRKGQYTYVWVFARKDGKTIDKDDAAYLRTNAPQVVDWVTTNEGKKVIAGTNFDLAQGNLALLKKRFDVEDYSGK